MTAGWIACADVGRCLDRGGQGGAVRSQPRPGSPCLRDIVGAWRVVGHKEPGGSAMSPSEADAWIGERASFETTRVSFHSARCDQPVYRNRVISADAFFAQFGAQPQELGLASSDVCLTTIECPGRWTAPGSLLIHSSHGLITLWDGIFFELARD